MAEVATRNKFEQVKDERDPLSIGEDIEKFASEGWESISDADRDVRLKWYGIFYRKQTTGHFMIRIRIPGGIANAAQVRVIGEITNQQGRGTLDLTTRQQVQLRWIRIEDMPLVLERLRSVGLLTLQTGLDNVRGVVGCAVAGLSTNELFDATPVIQEFNETLVGNREFTNLPRKFNVGITGCTENCTHAANQDVAMVPAMRNGVSGFNVFVGGKMGSGGFTAARPLDAFIEPEKAAALAAAITLVYRDYGSREIRTKNRLSFLIDEWGVERFRETVEARLGYDLDRAGEDMRGEGTVDHIGVYRQRQDGMNYAGLLVPVGRATGDQMVELARVAETHGDGGVRFTIGQNVIVTGISDEKLGAFLEEPLLEQLRYHPSPIARGTVSCTGMDYCSLALIETKTYARDVIAALEEKSSCGKGQTLSVHWSGCPAGCGNHQAADIGLLGRRTRVGDEIIDTVDIFVGGSAGPNPVAAIKLMEDVPCADVASTIEFLAKHVDFKGVRRKLTTSPATAEAATV